MMAYYITSTPVFNKQFDRLCKKYPSLVDDVHALMENLTEKPVQGSPLGKGLYKVRLKISSKGQGKSGGARVITCVKVVETKVVLVTMYDKSETENLTNEQINQLLKQL